MPSCTCGLEVRRLEGKLWQEHTKQRHFAELNRRKGKKPRTAGSGKIGGKVDPQTGLSVGMTDAEVLAQLRDRARELEREGKVT